MALKRLTPNLMVENVADTVEFYEKTLGFTLQQSVPEGDGLAWASVRSGDVEIMFQSRSSLSRDIPALKDAPAGGALTLYIQMEGLDDLHARVKGRVDLVQERHTTFYGMTEFAVRDPNGFLLVFAEPVGASGGGPEP